MSVSARFSYRQDFCFYINWPMRSRSAVVWVCERINAYPCTLLKTSTHLITVAYFGSNKKFRTSNLKACKHTFRVPCYKRLKRRTCAGLPRSQALIYSRRVAAWQDKRINFIIQLWTEFQDKAKHINKCHNNNKNNIHQEIGAWRTPTMNNFSFFRFQLPKTIK